MSVITHYFTEFHKDNLSVAKYRIGEEVVYNPLETPFPAFRGKKFIVTGLSWADMDNKGRPIIEYSLNGFPYLVWEDELEKIQDATYCLKCGAPKTLFKCSYCGV